MDSERDILLKSTDSELSEKCRMRCCKGTGPGGQKRNKTATMVNVELPGWGISASDCTERSQFRNRANALRKLRMLLALNFRNAEAEPPETMTCSMSSPGYPLFAAKLLDMLTAANFDPHPVADRCGVSVSALLKKICRDPQLWQFFLERRRERELPPLHPPR